jgi:hypothetical protein
MRYAINSVFFSGLLAAAVLTVAVPKAHALSYDGTWSIVIITEKGDCDRAYRYALKVEHGQVSYAGDAAIKLAGTVSSNGLVKVNIRAGEKGADGTGHLAVASGSGVWRTTGSNAACSGHWEAERH